MYNVKQTSADCYMWKWGDCNGQVWMNRVCPFCMYIAVWHCMYVFWHALLDCVLQHACITWVGRWGETRATWRDLCFSARSWLSSHLCSRAQLPTSQTGAFPFCLSLVCRIANQLCTKLGMYIYQMFRNHCILVIYVKSPNRFNQTPSDLVSGVIV